MFSYDSLYYNEGLIIPDRMKEPYVKNLIKNYSKEINSRIIIVDNDYVVRGDSNNSFVGYIFKHIELQRALKGESVSNVYNFEEYGHVMYVAVPIISNNKIIGATLLSSSIDDSYNLIKELNKKLFFISLISIIFISLISFIFAGIIANPINKFINVINNISKGKLGERVQIESNDEFKMMADAFNVMIMKLEQVDKQRKDFVANVSHELRTPLSSIKLLAESLLTQKEQDISYYKEFLKDIDSEIDRLSNIINDLLLLVDLDKEKLKLNISPVYINFLLENIIKRFKPLANKKSIDLQLKLCEKIQMRIDGEKMQQAIINIIHNAIKYTPEGGRVRVSLYSQNKQVKIKVEDNGIGIPKESLSNIFDRFYRVDKARSRATGGTGLGLSIASQIVSLHGGSIEVESKLGEGSKFYIVLPYDIHLM